MARQEGVTLGPYRVIEQVGAGGMATVYKAYQPSMERYVALKILPQHYARDSSFIQRFIREARTIARLEHRNILPVYDFGEQDGITYLAMRFLEGGTLKDILQLGRLTLADVSELLSQVAAALDYAHRQGVIHRDVKPANIMIDNEGWAYLTDFGIAKALEGTSDLTQGAIGTPAYMAPEQSLGQGVDARTDIYALGIILYEMVTGRVPYEADTPMAVALAHVHSPLPMPHEIDPDVPEPIERVILKAVAKEPGDRYQTADAFASALQEAITEAEVDASQTHIRALADKARDSFVSQSQQVTQDDFAPALPSTQPAPAPAKPKRWPLIVGILAAVVVNGGAVAALLLTGVIPGMQTSGTEMSTPAGAADNVPEQEQEEQPTAIQPPSTGSDVPLYDDFSTTGNGLDTDRWDFLAESAPECIVERADGVGIFSNQSSEEFMACTTLANRGQVSLESFGFMEADLYIAEDASGDSANLELEMYTEDIAGYWLAACGLQSYGPGQYSAVMYIEQLGGTEPEYWEGVDISAQEWHQIRLEADPITAEISCYVDDRLIGRHLPQDADSLQNANFTYDLVSWYEPGVTGTFWADNVRLPEQVSVVSEPLEYVEGEVLFEDNFEDGSNDGWSAYQGWTVVQDEAGNLVLQGAGSDWSHTFAGSEDWVNYAFEVDVRVVEFVTPENDLGFSIAFRSDMSQLGQDTYSWNLGKGFTSLGHNSANGWRDLAAPPGFQLPIDTWMTVRVEVFDGLIRGYVDGQKILEITDSEPLPNGKIGFSHAPTNTVWFDNVLVVKLIPASN